MPDVGNKVGDSLDAVAEVVPNEKVKTGLQIGSMFARLGQAIANSVSGGKKKK